MLLKFLQIAFSVPTATPIWENFHWLIFCCGKFPFVTSPVIHLFHKFFLLFVRLCSGRCLVQGNTNPSLCIHFVLPVLPTIRLDIHHHRSNHPIQYSKSTLFCGLQYLKVAKNSIFLKGNSEFFKSLRVFNSCPQAFQFRSKIEIQFHLKSLFY